MFFCLDFITSESRSCALSCQRRDSDVDAGEIHYTDPPNLLVRAGSDRRQADEALESLAATMHLSVFSRNSGSCIPSPKYCTRRRVPFSAESMQKAALPRH
jgi:hypothetical protein